MLAQGICSAGLQVARVPFDWHVYLYRMGTVGKPLKSRSKRKDVQMTTAAAKAPKRASALIAVERFIEASITSAVAWIFGITTSVYLLYLFADLWLIPQGHMTALWPLGIAPVNDWGLTYTGREGAFLALGEACVALVALAMSMVVRPFVRRIGLVLCLAWPMLWAMHMVLYASFETSPRSLGLAVAMMFVCACAVHRGARLWRQHPKHK